MKLKVLGSSSAGNGYILEAKGEALLLEARVPFIETKKALNFQIAKAVACLITHEHKDHAGRIEEVMASAVPCYCSEGTARAIQYRSRRRPGTLQEGKVYEFGSFRVIPFGVVHDAAQPFGYYITHPDLGNDGEGLLFATDTPYLKHTFTGLHTVLIEANYSLPILAEGTKNGRIPAKVRDRIIKSHMSLEHAVQTLQANDLSRLHNVVLIHLSSDNSNAAEFKLYTEQHIRAAGAEVFVAQPGLEITLNDLPF